jgi:hypothetical protein
MHLIDRTVDDCGRRARIAKLGPVLVGEAEFSVSAGIAAGSAVVQWREVVSVPPSPSDAGTDGCVDRQVSVHHGPWPDGSDFPPLVRNPLAQTQRLALATTCSFGPVVRPSSAGWP